VLATVLAATSGDVTKAGKAIGLALGVGLGALGAGVGIGNIVVFYGLLGSILAYVLV
jgi:F0F1-type ATP synthase membrane subunit c/vacuolar-type H+-ATPase subunit K